MRLTVMLTFMVITYYITETVCGELLLVKNITNNVD